MRPNWDFGVWRKETFISGPSKKKEQLLLKNPELLKGKSFYRENLEWRLQSLWLTSDWLVVRLTGWCYRNWEAGTWDQGPFVQGLHLGKCLKQQNTKKLNYKKIKLTACMLGQGYGQQDTKRQKKKRQAKKPNCHFWRTGSKSRVMCMPCTQHCQRGEQTV